MEDKYKRIWEFWIHKWKSEFLQELVNAPKAARAVASYPTDQILDFIEMINSNIGIVLLAHYGDELIDMIADAVDAEKYRVSPEELKKELAKEKKKNAKKLKKQ